MPTATEFTALGAGNGFPFCLAKVDVSDYAFKEPLTLSQATSYFWNIESASATAISSDFGESSTPPTLSEPLERVCGSKSEINSSSRTSIKVSTSGVILMYDGIVTNEENFMGYGIGSGSGNISSIHSAVFARAESFFGLSEVGIMSFQRIDNSGTSGLFGTIAYSTVTLGGVPFVKYTRQQGTGSSADITGLDFYTYP